MNINMRPGPRSKAANRLVCTSLAALAFAGILSVQEAMAEESTTARAAIAGTHPAWASESRRVSPAHVTSGSVSVRVYLAGQDPGGLSAYATAVSTPGDALYGHYLSPAEVKARFGPSVAEISRVTAWLTREGLTVTKVDDRVAGYVAVRGSVQAAAQAFSVTFGTFRGPDKKADRAPEQDASAPASVARDVLYISGLDTATHTMRPFQLPPPGSNYWIAPPCSSFYGEFFAFNEPWAYGLPQPWTNCGYTPRQIRGAYHTSESGMTGKGQTVAIVDAYASPTMLSDANEYARITGDRPFRPGQYSQQLASTFTNIELCGASGWYGEETLDVESVHGQAPDANVVFVGAASCLDSDLFDALALIVDNHLASIVSNSWGEPFDTATGEYSAWDSLFQAGAAEGIGFFFSAGDSGYESPDEDGGSDMLQVDWPTSSPWVTSVGGTSLAIGPFNNYEFETSWGTLLDPLASSGKSWQYPPPGVYPDYYDGSGGGGVSTYFPQPAYQAGVVPYSLATAVPEGTTTVPMRVVPDVSALADPSTGFLVGQTTLQPNGTTYAFSLSRIGGTSLSCPTFAGIQADAQQAAGHALGFANPAIYQRYGTDAFHDVTDHPFGIAHLAEVRNNYTDPATKTGPIITWLRTLGIDGEGAAALPAVEGYDDSTGVGSPDRYIESFGERDR